MSIDWTKISKKYKGLWLAFKEDEATVVASGNTAKEVLERAKTKGVIMPILIRVPNAIVSYVGVIFDEI